MVVGRAAKILGSLGEGALWSDHPVWNPTRPLLFHSQAAAVRASASDAVLAANAEVAAAQQRLVAEVSQLSLPPRHPISMPIQKDSLPLSSNSYCSSIVPHHPTQPHTVPQVATSRAEYEGRILDVQRQYEARILDLQQHETKILRLQQQHVQVGCEEGRGNEVRGAPSP